MTRQRRDFPEDFKRDAVALVTEQGYSIAEAARSLDVGAETAYEGTLHRIQTESG
jgi:transposase